MYPSKVFIARLISVLSMIDIILTAFSIPLVATILVVLIRDRTHSGPFFTIYKVGLTYDIIALIVLPLIGAIPTRGALLSDSFMESQNYLIIYHFFNYSIHFCQSITNTLICLNRATAVLLPLTHEKIWNFRFLLPCCFAVQLVTACIAGKSSLRFEMFLLRYATGERFPMVRDSPALRLFFTQVFVGAVGLCAFEIVLYSIVVWKFRANVRSMSGKAEAIDARRTLSLLCIALTVVAWETLYCMFYWQLFADFRMQYAVYFCLTTLYSSMPSYLIMIFFKPIRLQVLETALSVFGAGRKTSSSSIESTVKISTGASTTRMN